ncbi:hypothetical protein [Methylobacterium sp. CM6257]
MGHGGKRPGAGRRPLVTEEDRIKIALRYEEFVDRLNKCKLARDKAEYKDVFRLSKELKDMNTFNHRSYHINEKLIWKIVCNEGYPRSSVIKRSLDKETPIGQGASKLDDKVDQIRGIVEEDLKGKRLLRFSGPTGFRKRLFKKIADRFTASLGVEISPSYVKACVDQLRHEVKGQDDAGTDEQT